MSSVSLIIIAIKVGVLLALGGWAFTYLLDPEHRRWIRQRAVWLMPALFVLGVATPYLPAFFIALILILPIVARSRGEGAAFFLICCAGIPDLFQTLVLGGATLFQFGTHEALGLGLLLTTWVRSGPRAPRLGLADIAILAYVVLLGISRARGLNGTSIAREFVQIALLYAIPYIAIRRSITTLRDINLVLVAIGFAAAVQSLIALYEMLSHWPVYDTLMTRFDFALNYSRYTKIRGGLIRAHGSFPEPNGFAWFLGVGFIATLGIRASMASWPRWCVALLIVCAGMMASGSRGGWLLAALGFVAIDLFRKRYGAALRSVALAGAGYAAILAIALSTGIFSAVVGLADDSAGTVDYRKLLFTRGLEEIMKHPLFGTSLDAARVALADLRQGEGIIDFVNAYIYFGLTTGLVGAAVFLGHFLLVALAAIHARRRVEPDTPGWNMLAVGFAVSVALIVSAFASGYGGSSLIFYFALLAGIAVIPTVAARERKISLARRAAAKVPRHPAPLVLTN